MKYIKRTDEAYHELKRAWGGKPIYWIEVNDDGHAERQIVRYPYGNVVSYDRTHDEDSYGGLALMVIDGDEDWWEPYKITQEEFEREWNSHSPLNRTLGA